MNKSLNALMAKLNWQLNELHLLLQERQNQSQSLNEQIKKIGEQIDQSSVHEKVINPEVEINRLNFITQQHGKKEILMNELKTIQHEVEQLEEKIQRINIELKMLEKYVAREQDEQHQQQRKTEDNSLDEWVIQKRESV